VNDSGYKFILAYIVVIALVVMLTKTRMGYTIVYYTLLLSLLLLLVVNAKKISDIIQPISQST